MILRNGEPLTPAQMNYAHALKISKPEKVRLLKVVSIPAPTDSSLKAAIETTQLISSQTIGLSLRYGIFIRSDCWGKREIVVHELVHTSQYEKLGGIMPFLQQYLHECITIGYTDAPMEQEAIMTTKKLIG